MSAEQNPWDRVQAVLDGMAERAEMGAPGYEDLDWLRRECTTAVREAAVAHIQQQGGLAGPFAKETLEGTLDVVVRSMVLAWLLTFRSGAAS